MLRRGDINYFTVDAAGFRRSSHLYRNRILSIKSVNVTSFRIDFMFATTEAYVLHVCSKLSKTIMTSVLKTLILWDFKL